MDVVEKMINPKLIIIILSLIFSGCSQKKIILKDEKISFSGIKKKDIFDSEITNGIIGGTIPVVAKYNPIAIGGILFITYTTHKIYDYNEKPILIQQNKKDSELNNYLQIIEKVLLNNNYINFVSINKLKFPKIEKNFYDKKINKFMKINHLTYSIFIVINIESDNVNIKWDIKNQNNKTITSINTSSKNNGNIEKAIITNTKQFIQKIIYKKSK